MSDDLFFQLGQFEIGERVQLSVLGRVTSPRLKQPHSGRIVSRSGPTAYRVLFDGRKYPLTVNASYLERIEPP